MSRTRIVLMLVVAGGLGLVGSPQAQAAHKIKATATSAADPVAQYIASRLSNTQALITAEHKYLARQSNDIAKLLSGRGNSAALKADIVSLQQKIDAYKLALISAESYTVTLVNQALVFEANPVLKAQFALLNQQQQITTNFLVARPSATPFGV